jgi:hypothetical protein
MSNDKRLSNLQNTLTTVAGVVEQLANKLKDLNSQISQLSGNSTKLGKAQGKIAAETGKAAEATKKQAEATEKANKASKGFFGNIGKNIKTIISFYGAYQVLNLALTAFRELTVGSAKRAIALEKSLADLRAVAGLTADEVSRLKDVVFDVAGATSLTATEVVSLQKELAKLGSPIEEIAELTRPIALLSQALGEEAGGVAATLKKTLNQFQATAEEADKFANIITGAVNETALSMNDLGTALGYVGPLGAQLGVSFEETAALLGILADNGFKASKAGTGLRSFFIAAAKDGRPFNEFIQDVADRNLDAAESVQVFGKVAASQSIVLGDNVERYKQLSLELQTSNRLFDANAVQMASTQGQIDLLSSAYDKFSTRLGASITQTKIFINLIAILDKQASGLAGAYRILADQTEDTKNLTDELIESFRKFEKGEDSPISQSEALGRALRVVGEEGEFSKSTIDETYSLLMFYLKQGKDLQEAFAIASEKTGRGQLRLLTTTKELVELMYQQSKGIDEAYIAQEANNKVVKRYKQEYMELQALTKSGIKVDKEKQQLQEQINIDIARYSGELEGIRSIGISRNITKEEEERLQVLEKRIALLKQESEAIGELKVSDETLADQRKAKDKEAEDRFKTELNDYIERIKETEDVINNLRVEVGESAFPTQVDLLNGFFGGAEDIIAEATKRFGANSKFVKGLVKTFKDTADEISVQLPKEVGETLNLALKGVFGEDGVDLAQLQFAPVFGPEESKTLGDRFKELFKGIDWADVMVDSIDTAAEALDGFSDVALENTKNRLDQEIDLIRNRYNIEGDILKSQLDNQLITESQFRQKQSELRKAQVAEENDINRQIFNAEKKQDRQDASTDYLQAIASIIPTLIAYDKTADPVSVLTKAAITGGLATAAYGAEISAINQRKFFPKKFAEGGVVNGPSHSDGGVPFTVQGRGGYEMEGGEYIVNKRATSMHRDLLERINKTGRLNPTVGRMKFAEGGLVSSPMNESVDYLKAIAEATTSTAIGVSKPVRAYVTDKDLRTDSTERRIRDRNDRI